MTTDYTFCYTRSLLEISQQICVVEVYLKSYWGLRMTSYKENKKGRVIWPGITLNFQNEDFVLKY